MRGITGSFYLFATLLLALSGCALPERIASPTRQRQGMVFVLPGIEGRSVWNQDLALGLAEGGARSAIEVYDWTTGLPGGFLFNLADIERNRAQAARLAERIVDYQRRYPDRAVHLIGHSGGGGVVVLTLEALPEDTTIAAAILLGPALSPTYDLSLALRRTRRGIYNFYSERDVSFLMLGTSLYGTIDREYALSAGAVGFARPDLADDDDAAALSSTGAAARLTRRGGPAPLESAGERPSAASGDRLNSNGGERPRAGGSERLSAGGEGRPDSPAGGARISVAELYARKLKQVAWNPELAEYGASGTHLGWASRRFARDYLAPLIRASEREQPPPGSLKPLDF